MENIEQLLREKIESEMADLESLAVGSNEHKTAVDDLAKLTDRVVEIEKLKLEREDKSKKQAEAEAQAEFERELKQQQADEARAQAEFDKDYKERQAKEEQKDRLIKNCISVAGIVIPVCVTVWGTCKTIEFEKTGTITTIMGRGFINKLFPKK